MKRMLVRQCGRKISYVMRWKCEENAGDTVKQENKLCDEVEM